MENSTSRPNACLECPDACIGRVCPPVQCRNNYAERREHDLRTRLSAPSPFESGSGRYMLFRRSPAAPQGFTGERRRCGLALPGLCADAFLTAAWVHAKNFELFISYAGGGKEWRAGVRTISQRVNDYRPLSFCKRKRNRPSASPHGPAHAGYVPGIGNSPVLRPRNLLSTPPFHLESIQGLPTLVRKFRRDGGGVTRRARADYYLMVAMMRRPTPREHQEVRTGAPMVLYGILPGRVEKDASITRRPWNSFRCPSPALWQTKRFRVSPREPQTLNEEHRTMPVRLVAILNIETCPPSERVAHRSPSPVKWRCANRIVRLAHWLRFTPKNISRAPCRFIFSDRMDRQQRPDSSSTAIPLTALGCLHAGATVAAWYPPSHRRRRSWTLSMKCCRKNTGADRARKPGRKQLSDPLQPRMNWAAIEWSCGAVLVTSALFHIYKEPKRGERPARSRDFVDERACWVWPIYYFPKCPAVVDPIGQRVAITRNVPHSATHGQQVRLARMRLRFARRTPSNVKREGDYFPSKSLRSASISRWNLFRPHLAEDASRRPSSMLIV